MIFNFCKGILHFLDEKTLEVSCRKVSEIFAGTFYDRTVVYHFWKGDTLASFEAF